MLIHQGKGSSKEKTVIVRVYVDRPIRIKGRALSPKHHHCWIVGRDQIQQHGVPVKGYSRKAELLQYCQLLRKSARSGQATPITQKPVSSHNGHQPLAKLKQREEEEEERQWICQEQNGSAGSREKLRRKGS
ncbi:uncharacterized protein LOC116194931 isoform X2 [Punica granatum]|uniref:Uncharacterized protein LOC116194931 isoform X2 n=1 Tax=Punica granatum TaxID=22663 RepID=A0A6P8CBG9_PUNGR|nr:uncharacterized protein LOC116194931 isoform X2 [Punica granatum]